VSDQVQDILQRYERMNPNDKYWISSAFSSVLSELETQFGPIAQWDPEHKKQVAKQVMQGAQQAFTTRGDNMFAETSQLSAHGGALVSCYLELQTLPGDQATEVIGKIEGWRERAQKSGPYAGASPR
jgi:hypothetical protein